MDSLESEAWQVMDILSVTVKQLFHKRICKRVVDVPPAVMQFVKRFIIFVSRIFFFKVFLSVSI